MTIFLNYCFDKILAKYSLKRTKLHHFKKISRRSMPPNSPNKRVALPRGACHANTGAYAGFLRGGGPTLKFLGFWIYMPRSGMSRAAKLRAFARGVWGHAPPRKFLKMVQFRAF